MKLIDAAKAAKKMKEAFNISMWDLVDAFAEIPQVDAQPVVKGEWIYIDEFTFGNPYGSYRCSICGNKSGHKKNYCPDCGADMGGKTDGKS